MFVQTVRTLDNRDRQSGHAAFSALVRPVAVLGKFADDPRPGVQ